MQHAQNEPNFPGMTRRPNPGAAGGVNHCFENGWTVTVRGGEPLLPAKPNFLVFVGFHGRIHKVSEFITSEDATRRPNDDKHFLSRDELHLLLRTISMLDGSGSVTVFAPRGVYGQRS